MYYNTTKAQGAELKAFALQAKSQDQAILNVFQQLKVPLAPSDVLEFAFTDATPITSIRRGFNTLTDRGLLAMTSETQISPYGKPEHFWKLA